MKDYHNSLKNKIPKISHRLIKSQNRKTKLNKSTHQPSEINYKIKVDPDDNFSFGENILTKSNDGEMPKRSKTNREKNYNNSQLIFLNFLNVIYKTRIIFDKSYRVDPRK